MKKRIYKINNKNLVTGNPNEVTENEILVKENNDGTVELSHRNNGTLETLGNGGNGGGNEPIYLKTYNEASLGRVIEISDPINFVTVGNDYANTYQAYFDAEKYNIPQNTFDTLKFTNITINGKPVSGTMGTCTTYLFKSSSLIADIVSNNDYYVVCGFFEFIFSKQAAELFKLSKFSSSLIGGFTTLGATDDAQVSVIDMTIRLFLRFD